MFCFADIVEYTQYSTLSEWSILSRVHSVSGIHLVEYTQWSILSGVHSVGGV